MKNYILPIILGMFLVSLVSATTIYGGDNGTINLPNSDSIKSVTYEFNSTPLYWFHWIQNDSRIDWWADEVVEVENFKITWCGEKYEVEYGHHGGSTGGGGARVTPKNKTIVLDNNTMKIPKNETKEIEKEKPKENKSFMEKNKIALLSLAIGLIIVFIRLMIKYFIQGKREDKKHGKEEKVE